MFPKLSIMRVFKDHFNSLKSFGTQSNILNENGKHTVSCIMAFLVIPLLITTSLYVYGGKISDNTINLILTSNSIFTALLLNLVILLYSMKEKIINIESDKKQAMRKKFIGYTFANVSFLIIICLLIIALSLLHELASSTIFVNIVDTIIIFLMIQVILGILLILNRLASLFSIH